MPGPLYLEGETVELRTIEPEDAEDCQRFVNDPRVREGLLRVGPTSGPEEDAWIESVIESDEDVVLGICLGGDLVGTVALHDVSTVNRTAELGYVLEPPAWGQGHATDAATAMARHAFEQRALAKLYAHVLATNPASRRVLEKVGFVEEGVFREHVFRGGERVDVHRYGLLADEFEGR